MKIYDKYHTMKPSNSSFSNLSPLVIALFVSASLYCVNLHAQEDAEVPSNPAVAGPNQGDEEALQGMRVEEGLGESEPEGLTEGQQSYINNKAEEDEEIKKEEADAEVDTAEAEEMEATEAPFEAPVVEPEVGVEVREPIVE
jgi:hypothetical protein